ncbi:MAG: chromosomal replication initiator protein DnaA, partial [Bacteroidales bacterium]|nr:chromosomal replication initiator protein DnaA [Bacteroidales bacterium]
MNGTDRHIAVWNNCLQIIESNIDPQKFSTWFKPIRPVSLVDSTLTVEVPSDFFRDYIEGAYLDLLKLTLKRAIGAGAQLHYMVRPVQVEKPMVYPASHGLTPTNKTVPISTYQPS